MPPEPQQEPRFTPAVPPAQQAGDSGRFSSVAGPSFAERAAPTQGPLPGAERFTPAQAPQQQSTGWWDQMKFMNPELGGLETLNQYAEKMGQWGAEKGRAIGRGYAMNIPGEVPGFD